jgi:hypothetical protein
MTAGDNVADRFRTSIARIEKGEQLSSVAGVDRFGPAA